MKPISKAFIKIVDLAFAVGANPLSKHAGCWEYRIDEQWEIAVNGQAVVTRCSHGVEIDPFYCYVQFNGWPAGVLSPAGGMMAAGSSANEEELMAALDRAIAKKKEQG